MDTAAQETERIHLEFNVKLLSRRPGLNWGPTVYEFGRLTPGVRSRRTTPLRMRSVDVASASHRAERAAMGRPWGHGGASRTGASATALRLPGASFRQRRAPVA